MGRLDGVKARPALKGQVECVRLGKEARIRNSGVTLDCLDLK